MLFYNLSLQVLHTRYPDMMAVDIDQRAIQLLTESLPSLNLVHSDVLQIDYTQVKHYALHSNSCKERCENAARVLLSLLLPQQFALCTAMKYIHWCLRYALVVHHDVIYTLVLALCKCNFVSATMHALLTICQHFLSLATARPCIYLLVTKIAVSSSTRRTFEHNRQSAIPHH
jgi:hypothetical protein